MRLSLIILGGILLFSSCFEKLFYKTEGIDLIIKKIDLNEKVLTDDYMMYKLEKGAVLHPFSTSNNIVIFGHSGNHKFSVFRNLNKLKVGDEIFYLKTKFVVKKTERINADDLRIFNSESGRKTLSLVTCVLFNRKKRLVVIAIKK